MGTPVARGGPRYAPSPSPNKFGKSVMGTRDTSGDPAKKSSFTPRNNFKTSVGPRTTSALGQSSHSYDDDEDTSSIGMAQSTDSGPVVSSFSAKIRPSSSRANDLEVERLRAQLEERDQQLREQASSLAEMESSLNEVQSLMGNSEVGGRGHRGNFEDKDAAQLRAMLREKNDKIAMLTAEFDAHRADFRSTIDTLELASTETERVYEKRVEDLLDEVREYQERSEDVESVARQLKQLEELVAELEEGLEDARRGEAEARGEVEFLRGEVERGRSELRREREKAAAAAAAGAARNETFLSKELEQRDDEIRGLKAIIHSLSRDSVSEVSSPRSDMQRSATHGSFSRPRRPSQPTESAEERQARERLEQEVAELRNTVDHKSQREEELERELEGLRRGSASTATNQRASGMTVGSNGTVTQNRGSDPDPKGTVASWKDREAPRSPDMYRRGHTLESMPESEAVSETTDASTLWCEICETAGHDILTCTNMFGNQKGQHPPEINEHSSSQGSPVARRQPKAAEESQHLSPEVTQEAFRPAPLSPSRKPAAQRIVPNLLESGPAPGKESGVIDESKWCALCERDGHESVDCPFEDAF
jgi:chromosome segregation ATPase